jgi:hypothetical protein
VRVFRTGPGPCLAVGSIDLDDVDVLSSEEPCESRAIGTCALDADLGDVAELTKPLEQLAIALGVRRERLGCDEPAERVESRCDVDVEVCVDAPSDDRWCFYDGHGHPFLP